eukprot:gene34074-44025_t
MIPEIKRQFIMDKVRDTIKRISDQGYAIHNWKSKASDDQISKFIKLASKRGIILTKTQLAMLQVPNSPTSLNCYCWMDHYFELVGDKIPNSDGEIHLEPTDMRSIWKEYLIDMRHAGERFLCYSAFNNMTFYMGEREQYAARIRDAMNNPGLFCSIISDGMAQSHCELPYFGNSYSFPEPLTQHFQGCLNHGRSFTIFRTFHNVFQDSNAQIHSFLLTLEETAKAEGGILPDTIYYQIDGGSENTASIQYEQLIKDAFGKTIPVYVKDLWVIPDYEDILLPHMDMNFGRYAKMEWTQLQFIFEAVPVDVDNFPLGVKTTYRRYSADEVIEIKPDADDECGFQEYCVESRTYPLATEGSETQPARPAGMYLLRSMPTPDKIKPIEFAKEVPESDDVQQYLEKFPDRMHIPFGSELFGTAYSNCQSTVPAVTAELRRKLRAERDKERRRYRAAECVTWEQRGDRRPVVSNPLIPIDGNGNEIPDTMTTTAREPSKQQRSRTHQRGRNTSSTVNATTTSITLPTVEDEQRATSTLDGGSVVNAVSTSTEPPSLVGAANKRKRKSCKKLTSSFRREDFSSGDSSADDEEQIALRSRTRLRAGSPIKNRNSTVNVSKQMMTARNTSNQVSDVPRSLRSRPVRVAKTTALAALSTVSTTESADEVADYIKESHRLFDSRVLLWFPYDDKLDVRTQ